MFCWCFVFIFVPFKNSVNFALHIWVYLVAQVFFFSSNPTELKFVTLHIFEELFETDFKLDKSAII